MKRSICILMILCVLFLSGCSASNYKNPVVFYYPRVEYTHGDPSDVFASQTRDAGNRTVNEEILALYLQGPTDPDLVSPFPQGTVLISMDQAEQVLHITLSDSVGTLTGIDLTLACASLAKTCMELTGAEMVEIRAETVPLDGETAITISDDSLILLDEYPTPATEADQ